MKTHPDIATVASLIGEPARAAMLVELFDGRALTASELAARADVAPSTASDHLRKLVDGALLALDRQGRNRFYWLASAEVASALEALGTLARLAPLDDPFEKEFAHDLRFARSCYDHVAGRLGVAITDALVARQLLIEDNHEYRISMAGETWFAAFGVDLATARSRRRIFARQCLDWSERRAHLAGALGAALFARLLEREWIERHDGERILQLTPDGEIGLAAEFGRQSSSRDMAKEDWGTACTSSPMGGERRHS